MAVNECIAYYDDGQDLTVHAGAALTGKRFLKISANKQAGTVLPAGSDTTAGANIVVITCTAAAKVAGVCSYDVASGKKGTMIRGSKVVPVTAGAAITAGQEVESDANGKAIPLASGKAAGLALADAASGADAMIALYL